MTRVLALLLLAAGLAATPSPARGQEKLEWYSAYGGPKRATHLAVTRAENFRKALGFVSGPQREKVLAQVDFARQMLIGICLGVRPTGGYRVEFRSVEREGKNFVVRYEEVPPKGFVTQALTTPCLVKVVPRPEGAEPERVIFERTTRRRFPNDKESKRR